MGISDVALRLAFLISTGQDIEQHQAQHYYDLAGKPKCCGTSWRRAMGVALVHDRRSTQIEL
ncbi:MAG: hypothetical protein ACE5OS_04535 [Anaerolineae bacterium]